MITEVDNNYCRELLNQTDLEIIDVRNFIEYIESHIPNSFNIDVMDNGSIEKLDALDKKKSYLVYCTIGVRSKSAVRIMAQLGFENVFHLTDGIVNCPQLLNSISSES